MANIKSAKKRIGITARKTEVNKARKSEIKTYIKKFDQAVENDNLDEARELLKLIDKNLKKAVAKNTIHKNTASRKVSNLTRRLNAKEDKAI
ncbi:MAG: 30S ribosomal protein S20 [Clostridiaceae bacterium]|nr:30S ribosomal protein S20 [Clostridiaceae bacterium]MBW4859627.1 30S ribosomal protein S20 [Clostridiaceae bacterium]MBW4868596.1 30S ribosomal protein S20 [Clostridiaceae bacterium]